MGNMLERNDPQQKVQEGTRLARGPWRRLIGEKLLAEDPYRAAITAMCLENTRRYILNCDEATQAANIGTFNKFAFPIIRTVIPNLIATDLVSVQPMDGPLSLVFYFEARYAKTKGSILAGQTVFSARNGHDANYQYTSEVVDVEAFSTGDGTTVAFGPINFQWTPVRPNSVRITAGSVFAFDDGNGGLMGTGIASGSINYQTGAASITFSVAPTNALAITATYAYNSEANNQVPELDILLSHSPVEARSQRLRSRWSIEAQADLKAMHNLDAEAETLTFLSEEIRFEIDRGVIVDLLAGVPTFDTIFHTTPPSGVSLYEHNITLHNSLVAASNIIFQKTRRATGNWAVTGVNGANIIETLPNFKAEAVSGSGVVDMGTLMGRWRIYKDPYMDPNTILVGHRGPSIADAGYAYCPYVPLYRTPTIYLDDFQGRVGLLSRYGKKMLNSDFYTKIQLQA